MLLGLALLLASPATASPETQRLDDHTVLVRGGIEPGRRPDGNSVIIEGPDGLVVVDTGRHAHSDAILAATAGKPITLPAPFLDTACPEAWEAALDSIQACNFTASSPATAR